MKNLLKQVALVAAACVTLGIANIAIAQDDSNTPGQESAGQYLASSGLTAKVKAKLMADSEVKSLDISVASYKSTVQLCGFVDDRTQIKRAVDLAKSVEGVKEVKNCLAIKH
jgi:hyperosmotically inducible protein